MQINYHQAASLSALILEVEGGSVYRLERPSVPETLL
jgi:hypothetical protein